MSRFVGSPRALPFSTRESNVSTTTSPPDIPNPDEGSRAEGIKASAFWAGWDPATSRLEVENEGNDPRDEDRDDRQRDGRQPSQDADVIGPHGHGGHLPVHHVHPEEMANVLRGLGSRAVLEDRL